MPHFTLPVANVIVTTPRTRLVRLALERTTLEFEAGQAVFAGRQGAQRRRPYSIACSREHARETRQLELLVALDDSGERSAHLAHSAAGELIEVEGPLGEFTVPDDSLHGHVLFVAGGTGIAPLRAMLDHILRGQADASPAAGAVTSMTLLYSARRADEFAFSDELERHVAAGRLRLHRTVTRDDGPDWDGNRGRIGRTHFASVLVDPATTIAFICGPPPLVRESVATLGELGVPTDRIRTERWGR